MREIQQERTFHKMLYSTVTIALLSVLVLLLLRATVSLYTKRNEIVKEREKKEEELQKEQGKLQVARDKKEYLETDRGREEYLRTTFPVASQGEGVIIVYDDNKRAVSPVKRDLSTKEKLIHFWRGLFGGAE